MGKRTSVDRASTRLPGKHFTKKHAALLLALSQGDSSLRKTLLRNVDKAGIRCICECALNVLHGVVQVKHPQKKKLQRHRHVLRKLIGRDTSRRVGWQNRKRVLVQNGGGFLPLLLAPLIGTLISKLLGNKNPE